MKSYQKVTNTVVDSHCHLDMLKSDLDQVIKTSEDNGVRYMLTSCSELSDIDPIMSITKKHKNVFCTFGIHPEHADEQPLSVDEIMSYAKSMNAIAIGETGLDYFYSKETKNSQIESFKNHIIAASKLNLPVVIHSREAEEDTIKVLSEMKASYDFEAILHCFSSKRELADYAIKNDIYISASGIITFNKSEDLREIFSQVPKHLLLVETDAPFLAPTPFRGKECLPVMTTNTLKTLAEIQNTNIEKMAEITTDNFKRLFKTKDIR